MALASSPAPAPDPARTRTVAALLGSVGLSGAANIAMITTAPLVAENLLGSPRWSGVPSTVSIIGGALGTTLLGRFMARRGRYDGLVLGYAVAAAAATAAAAAIVVGSLPLFTIALFFVGVGAAANRLIRYASAELYPPARRAAAISWMVWGGTIGSVVGPSLLEPTYTIASGLSLPGEAGPFLLGTGGIVLSSVTIVLLASRPLLSRVTERAASARHTATELARLARVRLALLAMVVGQVVMVLVMTMTPIHIRGAGGGFASIGLVISAHTFGMFALSPVTGILCDRAGRIPVILAGDAMLVTAGVMAAAAGPHQGLLILSLFLLGLGWNFGFVAGSALLTDDAPGDIRMQLQGVADSVIWGSGAVASLSSGVLVAGWGYATLSLAGALLALIPMVAIGREAAVRRRRRRQASRPPLSPARS